MLCYQSSRKTNDVLHDTFAWLGMYRGCFMALWPVAVINALLLAWGGVQVSDFSDPVGLRIVDALVPFAFVDQSGNGGTRVCMYAIAALLTGLVTAPLMASYFVERRSLRRMTLTDDLRTVARHPWAAFWGAALMCAFACALCLHPLLALVLVSVLIWFIPVVIMRRWTDGLLLGERWWMYLCSVFLIMLMFFILQGLPALAFELIETVVELLEAVLPGAVGAAIHLNLWVQAAYSLLVGVTYTAACVFLLVASLMLHGAIYDER